MVILGNNRENFIDMPDELFTKISLFPKRYGKSLCSICENQLMQTIIPSVLSIPGPEQKIVTKMNEILRILPARERHQFSVLSVRFTSKILNCSPFGCFFEYIGPANGKDCGRGRVSYSPSTIWQLSIWDWSKTLTTRPEYLASMQLNFDNSEWYRRFRQGQNG
jgi:hypothetical protein